MNIENIKWDLESYNTFLKEIKTKADEKYKKFHSKLLVDEIPLIGIRTPILQNYAKQIAKNDWLSFIKYNTHNYYEEIILHGLILGYIKIEFSDLLEQLDLFLPYNTNWAINDIVCSNLKTFKKNQEKGFEWILKQLQSNKPWNVRFALILLLDHYINDVYIDKILKLCIKTYIDHYYANMAIAWLLSVCYIKYPQKTIDILKNKKLPIWIHNKTISKIRDSTRVSKEKKDYLKTLIR